MKTIALETTDLTDCIAEAQSGRVVVTRNGAPVALVVGVEGLDREQLELGTSEPFWKLIKARRAQKTLSRAELEAAIDKSQRRRNRQ